MKSFSPAGIATKGLFGYDRTTGVGAKSFGNPAGALTGGGAYPAGGASPNGPNQGGLAPPGVNPVLNLFITQDWIDTGISGNGAGLLLSQLMTPTQQGNYTAGLITTLNIKGGGVPARGYWVVSGQGAPPVPAGSAPNLCSTGFNFDLDSPNAVTVNLDTSLVRIYGGGGGAGTASPLSITAAGFGQDALGLFGGPAVVNLNITNQVGANVGRFYGGGGGGGGGVGNGGDIQSPCGGGGGAAGWSPGSGGSAGGGAHANVPGADGGVYDAANGGADDPAVAGGLGGATGGTGAGDGGGLAGTGTNSVTSGAVGGFAVRRFGQPGLTVFLTGGGAAFVIGTVE